MQERQSATRTTAGFTLYPSKVHSYELFVVRLPLDIEGREVEVRVGERVAGDVHLRDERTLIGRAPPDDVGPKDIVVISGGRQVFRAPSALQHLGASPSVQPEAVPLATVTRGAKPGPINATQPASNWWMLHQDLEHTGYALGYAVTPLRLVWKRTLPGAFFVSQPIVGDGAVLVGTLAASSDFWALDGSSGAIRWSRSRPGWDVWGHSVAANGRVYFIERQYGNTSELVCLAIADGSEQWKVTLPPGASPGSDTHSSGLAAASRMVFCHLRSGKVQARMGETGALVWEASVEPTPIGRLSSPMVAWNHVILGTPRGVRVFAAGTGQPEWSSGSANGSASAMAMYNTGLSNPALALIGAVDQTVRAHWLDTGALHWQFVNNMSVDGWTAAGGDRKVYLWQSSFRRIVEIDAASGLLTAASGDLGGKLVAPPTMTKDRLLASVRVGDGTGRILVLRAPGLSIESQVKIPEPIPGDESRPVVEGGLVFVLASSGTGLPLGDTIYAYKRRTFFPMFRDLLPSKLRRALFRS